MRTILGLVSLPGGGKTTVANILQDEYNFKVISVSHMLREMARLRGLDPNNRSDLYAIRTEIGDKGITKWVIGQIEQSEGERFAIDAIRQLPLDDSLREIFGENYKLLAIHTNQGTRYEAHVGSGREAEISRPAFIQTDRVELGHTTDVEGRSYDIKEIFERARESGFEIRNDERNLDQLKIKISGLMTNLLQK